MSIFIDENTRLIVQGITGKEGSFHAESCQKYGTNLLGGVTPNKGGTQILGVPVFDTVKEAVNELKPNTSLIFVPAKNAAGAIIEAAEAGIELIVCITEGIPVYEMYNAKEAVKQNGVRLIGPNCPGIISPGKAKVGIMPSDIHKQGNVGIISRSGTLTYEAVYQLTKLGIGQSTCVGIGGDPLVGTNFIDVLKAFQEDEQTDVICLIGEIGGGAEEAAADYIKSNITKPVVSFIAGLSAPEGKRMGHAGAIISDGKGTAKSKIMALRSAGVEVCDNPAAIGSKVEFILKSYKSCEIIEHGFDANIDSINLCCRVCKENATEKLVLINDFNGKNFNVENLFKIKNELRNQQKSGKTIEQCEGCLYLKRKNWDSEDYITTININNYVKCNLHCIYCDKVYASGKKEYNIYPLIRDLIKNNQLRPRYDITIAGGEPTISRDFDKVMDLFIKNNISPVRILTNGVKYNKNIEKGLKKNLVNILISPDSGTREAYLRIKLVDKFDVMWKNIKKYASVQAINSLVKTKYIILPQINDSKEEIAEFMEKNQEAGVKFVNIDIELNWFCFNNKDKGKLEEVLNLYYYAKDIGNQKGINVSSFERMSVVEKMLEKN